MNTSLYSLDKLTPSCASKALHRFNFFYELRLQTRDFGRGRRHDPGRPERPQANHREIHGQREILHHL